MIPLLGALLLFVAQPAPRSDSVLDAETRAVASTLRCPACEDVSIEDSPADLARDMRQLVRQQLAAGQTPAQVRQYFVDRYGEWVLLSPRPTSRTVPLWILPVLAVAAGGAGLAVAIRRWTQAERPPATDAESILAAMAELERDRDEGKVSPHDFESIMRRDEAELASIGTPRPRTRNPRGIS
jgi:cytochrome c-type biogenesis protein CcmH